MKIESNNQGSNGDGLVSGKPSTVRNRKLEQALLSSNFPTHSELPLPDFYCIEVGEKEKFPGVVSRRYGRVLVFSVFTDESSQEPESASIIKWEEHDSTESLGQGKSPEYCGILAYTRSHQLFNDFA